VVSDTPSIDEPEPERVSEADATATEAETESEGSDLLEDPQTVEERTEKAAESTNGAGKADPVSASKAVESETPVSTSMSPEAESEDENREKKPE
jgi:hypothetical protein